MIKNNKIPFKSNYFDSISIIELIEHLDRQSINIIISESFRVLKKNGLIIITTPNYNSLWPILEKLINKFSHVNYEEQHITKLNRKKLDELISKKKFKIIKVSSFMHIAPFIAFTSIGRPFFKSLCMDDTNSSLVSIKFFIITEGVDSGSSAPAAVATL